MSSISPKTLNRIAVASKYLELEQPKDKIQLTYIWVDDTGEHVRSKRRTHTTVPKHPSELPIWNYDGSSTSQADECDSDIYLHPVALYSDPILGGDNKLVLCETYKSNKKPTETNRRKRCNEIMEQAKEFLPWFGIKQEYTLYDLDNNPLERPKDISKPKGADSAFGRDVVTAHARACLHAGINIRDTTAEAPSTHVKWEFELGPCEGIRMGDDLWVARFLLHRIVEDFGVVSLDPNPVPHDRVGCGCPTSFSISAMRVENDMHNAMAVVAKKLRRNHEILIAAYNLNQGEDEGKTATVKAADLRVDIRIRITVDGKKIGYLLDRRPPSNCDPYSVMEAIVRTTCLNE